MLSCVALLSYLVGSVYGVEWTTYCHARISVYTPQLLRLEWSKYDTWDDRPSLTILNRNEPSPPFTHNVTNNTLSLSTGPLRLSYICTQDAFTHNTLSITIQVGNATVRWHPGLPDTGNLNGTVFTTDCYIGAEGCVGVYEDRMQPGLLSRDGWVLHDDTATSVLSGTPRWRIPRPYNTKSYIDWYFFGYGREYRRSLADFTRYSGTIPLMPYSAYGVWWSRYWPYSAEELQGIVTEYHQRELPLNMLVVDMDWHQEPKWVQDCGWWGGYDWNRTLFPDPKSFKDWVHKAGLQLMLNVHDQCGVDHCQPTYVNIATAMGINPKTNQTVACHFENKAFTDALYQYALDNNTGVDYWWTDYGNNTEGANARLCPGLWRCGADTGSDAVLWSNHIHAMRKREEEGLRGMVLTIYGGVGNHRYPLVGSGDTYGAWITLQWEVSMTSTAANVLVGWTHDVGGYASNGPHSSELFLRWAQFSCFTLIFRPHCDHCDRRPWVYNYYPLLKEVFQLRNSLVPYIYTMHWLLGHHSGVSIVYPLYYNWPELHECYEYHKTEYMFGDDILVRPITTAVNPSTNTTEATVWFPPGHWVSWQTGEVLTGPVVVTRAFRLDDIPLYVRMGSVIPTKSLSGQHDVMPDALRLTCFLGLDGSGRVYEDDGYGWQYVAGNYSLVTVSHVTKQTTMTTNITIVPIVRTTHPDTRNYEIRLLGMLSGSPRRVIWDGNTLPQAPPNTLGGWWVDVNRFGGRSLFIALHTVPFTKLTSGTISW